MVNTPTERVMTDHNDPVTDYPQDPIVDELRKVRDWAKARIDAGSEPPWAWFQYMKLIETLDAILAESDAADKADADPAPIEVNLPFGLSGST